MPGSEEGVAKLPRSPRNQADGGTPLGPSNRELRGQHKSGEGQGRGHGHQDKEAGQVLEAEKRGEDGGWHTAFRVSPVQQGLFQEFQLFKAHAHSQRDLQLRLPGVQERILPEGAFPEAQGQHLALRLDYSNSALIAESNFYNIFQCHRRGQDTHLDAMNGQSLMPSATDARGLPFFGPDLGGSNKGNNARKTSPEDARTSPYLSLYKPEDSNNLIRCLQ